MDEEFDIVTDNLNNSIININKILLNISNLNEEIKTLIVSYYQSILELNTCEEYELKYPYIGMEDEILYRCNVINNLGILLKEFSKIKYNNIGLNKEYLNLLNKERDFYITYGKVFFEPIAWDVWQNFVKEKLTLRNELINTLLLAIRIVQDEYLDDALDGFYELEDIGQKKKYEILDFMAQYHIEQKYIMDYFINNIVDNFIEVIYSR